MCPLCDGQCAPTTPEELSEEFWYACYLGDVVSVESSWLRREISSIDMNWVNPRQDTPTGVKKAMTPFYVACVFGNFEVVEFLLKNNKKVHVKEKRWVIDVHVTNDRGCNVIWAACNSGHIKILKLLLESTNVDFERPDINGVTPLDIAEANASTGDGNWNNGRAVVNLLKDKLYSANALSASASLQLERSLLSSHVGPMNSSLTPGALQQRSISLHQPSTASGTVAGDDAGDSHVQNSASPTDPLWRLATDPFYAKASDRDFEVAAKDLLQPRQDPGASPGDVKKKGRKRGGRRRI